MTEPPSDTPPSDTAVRARLEAEIAAFGRLVAVTSQARTSSEVSVAALDILLDAARATAGIVLTHSEGRSQVLASVGFSDAAVQIGRAIIEGPLIPVLAPIAHPGVVVSVELAGAPFAES